MCMLARVFAGHQVWPLIHNRFELNECIQSQNMKNDYSPVFISISRLLLSLHQDNSQSLLSYIVAYYLRHFDEVGLAICLFHLLN